MNQLLDSPLEALAFNCVSFGFFTIAINLWTWVAVVTAAVSFWRIRAAAAATSSSSVTKPQQKPSTCIGNRTQDESRPILEAEEKPTASTLVSTPTAVSETRVSPLVCDDGVTKGGKFKWTVYYEDDGGSDVDGEMTVAEWSSDGGGDCKEGNCGDWWESWERLWSLRKGETGWYRYLDLMTINGNVVRLWDESCRSRRRRQSSSCAVWYLS